MSRVELERFTADLQDDSEVWEEFANLEDDPGAWVRRARARGYHLTLEEAEGLSSSYGELSVEDIEQVAGGWTGDDGGGGG